MTQITRRASARPAGRHSVTLHGFVVVDAGNGSDQRQATPARPSVSFATWAPHLTQEAGVTENRCRSQKTLADDLADPSRRTVSRVRIGSIEAR